VLPCLIVAVSLCISLLTACQARANLVQEPGSVVAGQPPVAEAVAVSPPPLLVTSRPALGHAVAASECLSEVAANSLGSVRASLVFMPVVWESVRIHTLIYISSSSLKAGGLHALEIYQNDARSAELIENCLDFLSSRL